MLFKLVSYFRWNSSRDIVLSPSVERFTVSICLVSSNSANRSNPLQAGYSPLPVPSESRLEYMDQNSAWRDAAILAGSPIHSES